MSYRNVLTFNITIAIQISTTYWSLQIYDVITAFCNIVRCLEKIIDTILTSSRYVYTYICTYIQHIYVHTFVCSTSHHSLLSTRLSSLVSFLSVSCILFFSFVAFNISLIEFYKRNNCYFCYVILKFNRIQEYLCFNVNQTICCVEYRSLVFLSAYIRIYTYSAHT